VRLHASGATSLRVTITPAGDREFRLLAADPAGAPVISVERLAVREVSADALTAVHRRQPNDLFLLDWTPVLETPTARSWAAIGDDTLGAETTYDTVEQAIEAGFDGPVVLVVPGPSANGPIQDAHQTTHATLAVLRQWLTSATHNPLVVLTRE